LTKKKSKGVLVISDQGTFTVPRVCACERSVSSLPQVRLNSGFRKPINPSRTEMSSRKKPDIARGEPLNKKKEQTSSRKQRKEMGEAREKSSKVGLMKKKKGRAQTKKRFDKAGTAYLKKGRGRKGGSRATPRCDFQRRDIRRRIGQT